jgi:serine/threonine protein kinase/tetratricopeptide (TPR) repeat protein
VAGDAPAPRRDEAPTEERLDSLLAEHWERSEAGATPDPSSLAGDDAGLADALRERLAALEVLDRTFGAEAASVLAPGAEVGPYRVVREIGRGGMGVVFEAVDPRSGSAVALKILRRDRARSRRAVERFLREAEIGRRVRHGNVVRTLDFGETRIGGTTVPFLVMEFVAGRSLLDVFEDLGRLPEDLCRHVGREVARGLAALHEAGVVHRDVKPENVVLTRDHQVRLTDLGVARHDDDIRVSQTGTFVGSPQYAAPEQFRSEAAIDGRADLHALGVTLYEIATGVHPFRGEDFATVAGRIVSDTPRRCGELNPQLSPFFEEVVARLLAKDPDGRFASAADLAQVLDEGERSAWWTQRSQEIRAATRRPLRRVRVPRETSLHGRDEELTKLRAAWEKAKAGEGQVVLVEGEAGIGKSRLVDEFVARLRHEGEDPDFLFGSYPPGGSVSGADAFATAFREHLGDDESAVREAIPQTPLLVPAFHALLHGRVAPPGAEPLTKDSLATVFVHATRTFAAARPTIVLIDDLHFAGDEGRALFRLIALAVAGHRVLLVGAARPGLDESWLAEMDRIGAGRIALDRLGARDLVRLLVEAFRSERLAEDLGGKIAERSDGNPFFVFEIVRELREGGVLRRRADGTWASTGTIEEIRIPETVSDLVRTRLAALSAEDRALLEAASCEGFEFDGRLVAAALRRERLPVLQDLGRIERDHRLVRASGARFVFDHHVVQETLHASMSEPLREEYHAALGEALEAATGAAGRDPAEIDGEVCVRLAEHFLAGRRGARARRYLDPALTRLERQSRNREAIRLADSEIAVSVWSAPGERAALHLRKAERHGVLGQSEAARRALDSAVALADESGDATLRARARQALGAHLRGTSQLGPAIVMLRESQELARESGDRRTHVMASLSLALALLSSGATDEATACLEHGRRLARELGDRDTESLCLGAAATVLLALGDTCRSREAAEQQLDLARKGGGRQGQAVALGHMGNADLTVGRLDDARRCFEAALALARAIGDRRVETSAVGNLGNVLYEHGRYAEAEERFRWRLEMSRETGDRHGEAGAVGNLGSLCYTTGRLEEALLHCRRHLHIAREIGNRHQESLAGGNLALVESALGWGMQTLGDFERHLQHARATGNRPLEVRLLLSLATQFDPGPDAASVLQRYRDSVDLHRELGLRGELAHALARSGIASADLGMLDESRVQLEESVAIARELSILGAELLASAALARLPGRSAAGAIALAAEVEGRIPFWTAMHARLLLWQATRDRAHLVEAKRRLDFLVEHAPPEARESMLTNVRLHREIVAAARAEGIA